MTRYGCCDYGPGCVERCSLYNWQRHTHMRAHELACSCVMRDSNEMNDSMIGRTSVS